ncbi:winged helix-turn-helix domain-containing protein [Piscinibacter gummiphilus]|uniref:Winged helix-turn-helix domain-containing protein n=1 Tax=Piscinibacter gummiphilus TaxID=946333 RepID=A0ABZ0CVK0_9BURK|nr:winged helix-turn-helix domain-containing protein [Piscinibacter gummiphilus]WOB06539.1 winged helix-turn-helix domain-containing protein [Piscinibacter gummiphilus]
MTVSKIISALERCGQMSQAELRKETGLGQNSVNSTIGRLHSYNWRDDVEYSVHIADWTHEAEGTDRKYPRAVYKLGHGIDKPKPKPPSKQQVWRDWRARQKAKAASVFVAGIGHRRRASTMKAGAEAASA